MKKNTKRYMTKNEFWRWCQTDMQRSWETFKKKDQNMCGKNFKWWFDSYNGVCAVLNVRTGKSAVAKCARGDGWRDTIARAVAWAKYNGVEIPKIVEHVYRKNIKPGNILVDKRNLFEFEFIGRNAANDELLTVKCGGNVMDIPEKSILVDGCYIAVLCK